MNTSNNSSRLLLSIIGVVILAVLTIGIVSYHKNPVNNSIIQVVAGENFWGSLVSQLGGSHVHVTSIVSDPNADPHEYESSNSTARSFATANYVILNGAGYDSWGDKLLSASSNKNRTVLKIADLLGKKE